MQGGGGEKKKDMISKGFTKALLNSVQKKFRQKKRRKAKVGVVKINMVQYDGGCGVEKCKKKKKKLKREGRKQRTGKSLKMQSSHESSAVTCVQYRECEKTR